MNEMGKLPGHTWNISRYQNESVTHLQYADKRIPSSATDDGRGISHRAIVYDCKEKPRGVKSKFTYIE